MVLAISHEKELLNILKSFKFNMRKICIHCILNINKTECNVFQNTK